MTQILKTCVLVSIEELQAEVKSGKNVVDLAEFTREMQGFIIISCSVGSEYSKQKVEFELDDGRMEQLSISDHLQKTTKATIGRLTSPHVVMFPKLLKTLITRSDKIYGRNVERLRSTIRKFINERR
jgi:hypothetical protein